MLNVHCRNYLQAEADIINLLRMHPDPQLQKIQFYIYLLSNHEKAEKVLEELPHGSRHRA
jgi:hypothetical protein